MTWCYIGTLCHTPTLGTLELLNDHALLVDDNGFITGVYDADDDAVEDFRLTHPDSVTVFLPSHFLLPTFVDLHLHAPQYTYLGTGLHLPLMQWLDEFAYKSEEMLDADPALARTVYSTLARRLIEYGTGAALLFGTIKEETNIILADVFQNAGLRACVGKLQMDISSRPTYVEPSTQASIAAARSFITRCRALVADLPPHARLVQPVITPRFVPTCSDELLTALGELAAETGVMVQSHLAEAHDQVKWVQATRRKDDMDVFDEAHCTFLTHDELRRMAAYGSKVAHCPLSNAYFSAEPFPLREALELGVEVGLGSDCAGGYTLDIMNAMRHTVAMSRTREGRRTMQRERNAAHPRVTPLSVDWKDALYLATRGGSVALGLASGVFAVGAPFDAQCIQVTDDEGRGVGALDFFVPVPDQLDEATLEKWWCLGDQRNRTGMWVQGKKLL
ncbi:Metallo-dependent hydrolase [Exidia glandulosa HHB12029]|uniref:Metallo-dependent hydrolase n=1 Tax=Exidia glandulosa HHB12029 TaxID=1314781 RepID=A0A165NBQ0_EXIGL|nr:Metallo-dependent hydrolase [Exidia glandulosa HHB12029]